MRAAKNLDSGRTERIRAVCETTSLPTSWQSNLGPDSRLSVAVARHNNFGPHRRPSVAVPWALHLRTARPAVPCSASATARPPQLDKPLHFRAAQAALRCEAPMGQALPARRALKPHVFRGNPAATADDSVRYLVSCIVLYHTLYSFPELRGTIQTSQSREYFTICLRPRPRADSAEPERSVEFPTSEAAGLVPDPSCFS